MVNVYWLRAAPLIAATLLATSTPGVPASSYSTKEWKHYSVIVFPKPPNPYDSFRFSKPPSLTAGEMFSADMGATGSHPKDHGDSMTFFDRRFPEHFDQKKTKGPDGEAIIFPKKEAFASVTKPMSTLETSP